MEQNGCLLVLDYRVRHDAVCESGAEGGEASAISRVGNKIVDGPLVGGHSRPDLMAAVGVSEAARSGSDGRTEVTAPTVRCRGGPVKLAEAERRLLVELWEADDLTVREIA